MPYQLKQTSLPVFFSADSKINNVEKTPYKKKYLLIRICDGSENIDLFCLRMLTATLDQLPNVIYPRAGVFENYFAFQGEHERICAISKFLKKKRIQTKLLHSFPTQYARRD